MFSSDTDLMKQRRGLIDLVAETRSRAVRVALFGTQLHRTDPEGLETDSERASQLEVLLDTVRWLERVAVMTESGSDPWNEVPEVLGDWLASFVLGAPDFARRMRGIADVSKRVAEAAESKSEDLGSALREHYEFRRNGFMDVVTEFCDGMWAQLDAQREADVARATETGQTIKRAMKRLEHIGTHVRLVSLNASVEAARAGEAGRGLSLIASEFKELSEEIKELAVTAHSDIMNLTVGEAESSTSLER